jgi:hypothetical protein
VDSATFVQLAPGSYIIHLIYVVFVLVYAKNGRFIVTCVLFFAQQTNSSVLISLPSRDITQWVNENIAIVFFCVGVMYSGE